MATLSAVPESTPPPGMGPRRQSMFMSERHRRRWLPIVAAATALVAAAVVVALIVLGNRNDDVHKGDQVEFQAKPPPKAPRGIDWPFFHMDAAHRGYLPTRVSPPYRFKWRFGGKVLMEFPPIVVDGTLYFVRNNGGTYALDADTGHVKWKKRIGLESASSPAYWKGRIFVPSLSGKVVALRARDGNIPVVSVAAVIALLVVPAVSFPSVRSIPTQVASSEGTADIAAGYAAAPRCDSDGPSRRSSKGEAPGQLEGNSIAGEVRVLPGPESSGRGARTWRG